MASFFRRELAILWKNQMLPGSFAHDAAGLLRSFRRHGVDDLQLRRVAATPIIGADPAGHMHRWRIAENIAEAFANSAKSDRPDALAAAIDEIDGQMIDPHWPHRGDGKVPNHEYRFWIIRPKWPSLRDIVDETATD